MQLPRLDGQRRNSPWLMALLVAQAVAIFFLCCERPAVESPRVDAGVSFHLPSSTNDNDPVYLAQPGPWGKLIVTRIEIESPDQLALEAAPGLPPTQWFFDGYTPAQLETFFTGCDLTAAQRVELADTNAWRVATNGVTIFPAQELVLGLNVAARLKIYYVLAVSEENPFHYAPYVYRGGELAEWFGDSGVSPAVSNLVAQLVYKRGEGLCFSDLPLVLPLVMNRTERYSLLKTLSRSATMMVSLYVNPGSDVPTLEQYWERGNHKKDLGPLLDSLSLIKDGMTLDIVHLLPTFARERLYTYPAAADAGHDCFWTALNFFRAVPDEKFLDNTACMKELETNYAAVAKPVFGDVILLLRPDNTPIHAAVFIADNIVFTKNGGSEGQPWLLMEWDDMMAHYPESFAVHSVIFHPKELAR
jgi:hypothetical protein